MKLKIKSVFSRSFERYGKVLKGYDVKPLLSMLDETSPMPEASTVYEPSVANLESLDIMKKFSTNVYGGMDIQIGYCNGYNTKLNCLEYHRGSELNIPSQDAILLLASLQDVKEGKLCTDHVEAFRAPAGTVVQIYETTLHFAPCCDVDKDGKVSKGFRVIIVLPKGTNTDKPEITNIDDEDKLLWAKNKWLIAHADSEPAKEGAFIGLTGENIDLAKKSKK